MLQNHNSIIKALAGAVTLAGAATRQSIKERVCRESISKLLPFVKKGVLEHMENYWTELKRKIDALPEESRQAIRNAEKVKMPNEYYTDGETVCDIADVYDNNLLNAFLTVFKMGVAAEREYQKAKKGEKA